MSVRSWCDHCQQWVNHSTGECWTVKPFAAPTGCAAHERADAIIKDILMNHLPRIKEGLEAGYVDENQILVMYDHAVRARILKEHAQENEKADRSQPR